MPSRGRAARVPPRQRVSGLRSDVRHTHGIFVAVNLSRSGWCSIRPAAIKSSPRRRIGPARSAKGPAHGRIASPTSQPFQALLHCAPPGNHAAGTPPLSCSPNFNSTDLLSSQVICTSETGRQNGFITGLLCLENSNKALKLKMIWLN
jgi:hypothetical protein